MPSVGMRRTTRVFGVVKGADGARVLRSGRRLWPESDEVKLRRCNESGGGDDWFHPVIKKSNGNGNGPGGLKCKPNGWAHNEVMKVERGEEVVTEFYEYDDDTEMKVSKKVKKEDEEEKAMGEDRMFGKVYTRKRKRNVDRKNGISEDKLYGIKYFRRNKRKKVEKSSSSDGGNFLIKRDSRVCPVFGVVFYANYSCRSSAFLYFLNLVLGFVRRSGQSRVNQRGIAAFLLSQPTTEVLSPHGIRCLWDPPIGGSGLCKLYGAMGFTPLFNVDFSTVPSCFMYIHLKVLVRLKFFPSVYVNNSEPVDSDDDMTNIVDHQLCNISGIDLEYLHKNESLVPVVGNAANNKLALHPSVRASKLAGRSVPSRNGLTSRGIQKRRSSLRRRKARNPSLLGTHKANGALVSDLISSQKNGSPFSSMVSRNKLRSSTRSVSFREVSSNMDQSTPASNASCCLAGILVTESDRCYREEGATVMLELCSSREWLLVVKKDGVTKYRHKAQKVMRPCSTNRFTHATVWTGDDNWKLEFPSRQDWLHFKDLYKECYDRNAHVSAKVIPVPRVSEVSGYEDTKIIPFHRPDLYITVNGDEVSRALARRKANYDMDSEDEEWLKKFNNDHFKEVHEHVSEDDFELMVDSFEKAYYCSPDDFCDEKAIADLCLDLGRKEVVQAVFEYWMKKRKQKRSSLLRVFQIRQVKKTPVIPKPALRKRRSFKRQASQSGRGKQPVLVQAMVVERDALEEQNAMLKVEEAKMAANRAVEVAILQRRRAQLLMENADLATYKAAMALRIAEAAQVAESTEAAAAHFLDL